MQGDKPQMGQPCPHRAIKLQGWAIEPIQQQRQLALQTLSRRRLKMQCFPADRTRHHLHRQGSAQIANGDGPQSIGPCSKQIRMPPMQGCKGQWLIKLSRRSQQELHQTLHLGAGLPLWGTRRVRRQLKTPCHRRAHLNRIQLLPLNGGRAEALAADQRR